MLYSNVTRLLRRAQSRWGFQRGEAAAHPFGRTRGFKPRVRYNLIIIPRIMAKYLYKIPQRWVIYAFVALFISLSIFTIFGERGMIHLWRLRGEKIKLSERNFRLQTENEILRERILKLHHDNLYLEKVAREELGLVRPGEIVYRFSSSEPERNRTTAISEISSELLLSSEQKSHR